MTQNIDQTPPISDDASLNEIPFVEEHFSFKRITHYRLEDDRVWCIADAKWVTTPITELEADEDVVLGPCIDQQGHSTEEGLRECLKFYKYDLGELKSPEEKQNELKQQFTDAVQQRLDAFAQTRGYDGIMSAASYYGSSNPKFKAEADRAIQLRDNTWAICYTILDDVLAGKRPIPTLDEIFVELPELTWE